MSKVVIQGNNSGTGTFTVTAPNSNNSREITLPDSSGDLLALNSSGAISGTPITIDSNNNVGIGTSSPSEPLEVRRDTNATNIGLRLKYGGAGSGSAGQAYIFSENKEGDFTTVFQRAREFTGGHGGLYSLNPSFTSIYADSSGTGNNGQLALQAANAAAGTSYNAFLIRPNGSFLTYSDGGERPAFFARAWVNFNGTGTVAIRASGNVSSITDYSTGNYAVNFTTALPDINHTCIASCHSYGDGPAVANGYVDNTINAGVATYNTSFVLTDINQIHVAVFR